MTEHITPIMRASKVCLSNPGTNTKGQRIVDLSIDGMGFGYIVLDEGYEFEELAEALGASLVRD